MRSKRHYIIFIPRLSGSELFYAYVSNLWNGDTIRIDWFKPQWQTGETFQEKLKRLLKQIDTLPYANNVQIFSAIHVISIFAAITVYKKKILEFLHVK